MSFLALAICCDEPVTIKIGNVSVQNRNQEKLLRITRDNRLICKCQVAEVCQKSSNKLYALSHVALYKDNWKLRHLMRAFIKSQFQ